MYETELTIYTFVSTIILILYLEWCRRNRLKWWLDPIDAVLIFFVFGFSVEGYVVWINGHILSAIGHVGFIIMFLGLLAYTNYPSSSLNTKEIDK